MWETIAAAESEGGGAALGQVIGLSVAAAVVTAVLLWVGYLHRTRRIAWLARAGERIGARFRRPSWVALSIVLFTATLVCALFGFIWDVGLHIGKGRDPGPLANPAHYFILFGLFLLFVAGAVSMVLPYDRPGAAAVRITRSWYAPVGGLLMAGCGLYALIGFPLDDVWHRIFGQDVTLWGPTHLMLIGGAGLSLIAVLYLEYEGRRTMGPDTPPDSRFVRFLQYLSFGGLVVGLSVFQIEYDFGVEQFRLVLQPMMIAGAAACALVAARLTLGRGAAIVAAVLAIALRGGVSLVTGLFLGAPHSWFPLYLSPAVVVEILAATTLSRRPVVFGAIAGLTVGTVGIGLESLWIGAVYHYPWPSAMWPEALAMAVPVAILMGMCGALLAMVLTDQPLPRGRAGVAVIALTVIVIGGAVANGLHIRVPQNTTATVTMIDLPSPPGERMVSADIRINPPGVVSDNPEWVSTLSWQGGLANDRGLVVDRLERVGPGHYRSTAPIPVWGQWKTLLRLQYGYTMAGVPVYLPADPGIGAPAVPVQSGVGRAFVPEITILQRERDLNRPMWLFTVGGVVVLVCTLAVISALAWGGARINRARMHPVEVREPAEPRL